MYDGGIYGDMLAAFPELVRTYTVFDLPAKAGGGFGDRRNLRQVDGIFRRVPGGKMGIMGENRTPNDVGSFWTYVDEEVKIGQGAYFEDAGELMILTKDNSYAREGGYAKYTAALVPGPTDKQVKNPDVIDKALNAIQ